MGMEGGEEQEDALATNEGPAGVTRSEHGPGAEESTVWPAQPRTTPALILFSQRKPEMRS